MEMFNSTRDYPKRIKEKLSQNLRNPSTFFWLRPGNIFKTVYLFAIKNPRILCGSINLGGTQTY